MFGKKIKIKVNAEEYKLIRDALLDFRNKQIKKSIWKYIFNYKHKIIKLSLITFTKDEEFKQS